MPDDLGFESLLDTDGFYARLFGRAPSGAGRKLLYGPDLPVVLLTGGPGTGKGRLLRAVRDRFGTKVPVIYLDCAAQTYAAQAAPEPGARSEMTEALRETALRLSVWQGTGGGFSFPRLVAGFGVIVSGAGDGTPAGVGAELGRYDGLAGGQPLLGRGAGDFWTQVVHATLQNLAAAVAGPVPAAVCNALLDALFARLKPRGKGALQQIYGGYPGAGGQPRLGLLNLAADFRAGGKERELAEGFLFRALRADLEAAYASASGWLFRVGRPGLLLDRSETPLGERLLRSVLTDRRSGQFDRLVVVGTARRRDGGAFLHGGLRPQEARPATEFRPGTTSTPRWSRRAANGPARAPLADGVLLLRMPFLSPDQQREETERMRPHASPEGGANLRRIDAAVARLSGGRPHTVLRLAAAAADFRMPADANDRDLLDAPLRLAAGADGPDRHEPVTDVLLRELVEDQLPVGLPPVNHGQWLDLLTHLSVAHDEECANVLLRHHQTGRVHQLTAHHVQRLLTDTGWPDCKRHFIGDFGLRQLLLHRLYGLRPDGAAWYADHHLLRDHYRQRAAEEGESAPDGEAFATLTAHWLNHHLVSGGTEDVVRHLVETLPGRSAEWCAELLDIAQAPYPGGADARRDRAEGSVATADAPALERTVDQLLHAVWLCEERTRPTGQETARTLERLLERLTAMDIPGAGGLSRTASDWSELAANDQPLRRCGCTGQLGRRR